MGIDRHRQHAFKVSVGTAQEILQGDPALGVQIEAIGADDVGPSIEKVLLLGVVQKPIDKTAPAKRDGCPCIGMRIDSGGG